MGGTGKIEHTYYHFVHWPQLNFIDTDKEKRRNIGMDLDIGQPACHPVNPRLSAGDHSWSDKIPGHMYAPACTWANSPWLHLQGPYGGAQIRETSTPAWPPSKRINISQCPKNPSVTEESRIDKSPIN